MKAEEKPKYVTELRELLSLIDIKSLIENPNDLTVISKINRTIAILTNFSYNDGQELRKLFTIFQKWARSSSHKQITENRGIDMIQFIGQKIEEMDIYVIDPPAKSKQDRIIKNLKNEKLWVRSSLQGKDLHMLVGEREDGTGGHVHLISDSDTGEIRVDSDDKSPSGLIERVAVITMKDGSTIGVAQQGIKTTMEFFETNIKAPKSNPPILYATGVRHSGGPSGHIVYFTIKNIGKEIALDIHWGIRAFSYEWRPQDEPFELEPDKEKEVAFPVSDEKIFKEAINELNIIMEYKDAQGITYFTRRELEQISVPSGDFYNLKVTTFYPPSILVDDGLQTLSEPFQDGDMDEMLFGINKDGEIKKVKIGMSRSLSALLGFDTSDEVKQAILELAHRKIRKMIKENNLVDHLFTTYDLPEHHEGGFDSYIKLRDSVT
jgi:hypothetical protein